MKRQLERCCGWISDLAAVLTSGLNGEIDSKSPIEPFEGINNDDDRWGDLYIGFDGCQTVTYSELE